VGADKAAVAGMPWRRLRRRAPADSKLGGIIYGAPRQAPARRTTSITPMVGLRMPSEMREQVEKLAREDGVTLSKKILEMIAERLPKKKDK
jgi:Arc-like DNA binding domain